jgi:hypothetical protein
MRTLKLLATTLLVASLAATPLAALGGNGKGNGGRADPAGVSAAVLVPLTQDEIDTLLWMREEEKLARDVYIKMTEYYPVNVFSNIAAAEQKHFDAIGRKLEQYGIPDVALPDVGAFYDQDLQQMYFDFVAEGSVSYLDALFVGVAIEEADLVDLTVAIDGTDSRPLKRTYSHLLIGSQHHLDSFIRLLEKEGVDYEP